jgi:pimeloyl-ACP methyl ester carboxylesterase
MATHRGVHALLPVLVLVGGCAAAPSQDAALHTLKVGDRSDTLVVMLPGIKDRAEQFLVAGFVDAASEPFDVLVVDPDVADYFRGTFAERLRAEVIEPAQARGYDEIWLVGVSIGGYGSLLYAGEFPEDITGIVLLAPYLGGRRLQRAIESAGGLAAWADGSPQNLFARGWLALNALARRPGSTILLGFGGADRLAATYGPLVAALPPSHVYTIAGGHEWTTWAPLWDEIKPTISRAARSQFAAVP